MRYLSAVLFVFVLATSARAEPPAEPSKAIAEYVTAEDPSYGWKQRREGAIGSAKFVELTLTSQTWRDITWKHQLFLILPHRLRPDVQNAMLFITGGSWNDEKEQPPTSNDLPGEAAVFAAIAEQIQCPVAVLLQVPFQPMFDGKHEDEIIAYTFERFMRTGDDQWPLLLPMVKSAVRAMDATQEYAKQNWELNLQRFTVTGASKRGWTTWLTGAVDSRVNGIAPMVIDMLNMQVQMQYQLATYGEYSEEIKDYTELGLQKQMDTEAGQRLRAIVDPYSYREQLLVPKLIILGTNDAYWTLDALNNYWSDLKGPKYIMYVPNNGHGLNDLARLTGSLIAFHDHVTAGAQLAELKWGFAESEPRKLRLTIHSDVKPKTVQAWIAHSATKDFRQAQWKSVTCEESDGMFQHELEAPAQGYAAVFGEAIYDGRAAPYYLSTQVRILPE